MVSLYSLQDCLESVVLRIFVFREDMCTYIPWFMVSVSSLMDGLMVRVLFRMIYSYWFVVSFIIVNGL